MIEPHGGTLVDRIAEGDRAQRLRKGVSDAPTITLSNDEYQEAINIATGRYSPLEGFLTQNDFLKVVHDMTLEDGTVWTLPVTLDVDTGTADELTLFEQAGLRSSDGSIVGTIEVTEVYKYNREEAAKQVFGTTDSTHPGVELYRDREAFLVGGPIVLFGEHRYNKYDLLPSETRVLFNHRDWETVAGFQTRNAPHRAHEYIQKSALEQSDGLLIQPKLGDKKAGDYRDDVIMGAYQELINGYYPGVNVALSVFPSKMRYAGPREAVFDAIVRKNQGCTHFVVGRDHAGVGDFYDGFDAHAIFEDIGDIGIEPLFFSYSFYCERCDGMASEKTCPHDDADRIYPSGSEIRELVRRGEHPPEEVMRPEVASFVMDADRPFVKKPSMEESP